MDLETSGKPNHLFNFHGIDIDIVHPGQLANMSPEEFIATAEQLA